MGGRSHPSGEGRWGVGLTLQGRGGKVGFTLQGRVYVGGGGVGFILQGMVSKHGA